MTEADNAPVRIFIGSGEQSVVERRVLIHSLRRHTQRRLDLYVFNGTHNAIEHNDELPALAPLSLALKYRNITEFSLYRYLIPHICGFRGHALYLDSDMVCLADIGDLFDVSLDGNDFLAKAEASPRPGARGWSLSVMLIDCERCRFDLDTVFREIDDGLYTYSDFSQMGPRFLARHPYRIGALDPNWNVFDRWGAETKLIHYTDLATQPWKFPGHPYGDPWFTYFEDACRNGAITVSEIELAVLRGYVRRDLVTRAETTVGGLPRLKAMARRVARWVTHRPA